jgi:uncharacterized damage-inducible protein DinB
MKPAITLEELLAWNRESAAFWKAHLEANPALLKLPCGIGGAANVEKFVAHIWGAELRWSQHIAGLPVTPREEMPSTPLDAIFGMHEKAANLWENLLDESGLDWDATLHFDWLPTGAQDTSRRKIAAHALFHSQRHWAQLATLVRNAGFPSEFKGDLIFSPALR